jgi:PAS domain S-box-containing protein
MRSLFDLTGRETFRRQDLIARVHPDDRARVMSEVEESESDERPFQMEYRVLLPNRAERWLLVKGRGMPGTAARSTRRMGVVLDITERKHAEQKLRESEARFRAMADAAPVMIWMADVNGACTFFNNGWLEFTGCTLEQELNGGWTENVHEEDLERVLALYASEFEKRRPFRMEYRLRRHDGVYREMIAFGTPRFQPDGTFAGYIGTCLDVTELKRAEETLRAERAFLRQVIDVNPNYIFVKDRSGRFTLVNKAMADLYGATVDEMINKTSADFHRTGDEVTFLRKIDLEVMNSGQERFIAEERVTDSRGNVHWVQTVKRPLKGPDGRINHLVGAATDITQRRQAEIELQEQRALLAHVGRVSMMGELSASLAHELNQPLTAIVSNAKAGLRFINQEPANLNEVREAFNDIVAANNRAAEIIRHMRTLVKKEEDLQFRPVDLAGLVRDVVALVHTDAILHEVRILVEMEKPLPPAGGDPVQLQQVILNILLNAFDAMKACPTSARRIEVRLERHDNAMNRIAICDSGPGLGADELERIFQPFYTTKREGLGMGLSICRSIIEAHHGHLWAKNNPGRGATFYLTVPLYRET